jgi:hypothetical protein
MKKFVSVLFLIALSLNIAPAHAAETRAVTGVSAYYRADLGYLVGWKNPVDTKGIISYTVTANPTGKTCIAGGATNNKCVFTNSSLGFVNSYSFTVVANSTGGIGQPSAQSNTVKAASIPYAPQNPLAMVKSDTSIDIAWVPNVNDGGAAIYGYRVNVWESQANGDPGIVAVDSISTTTNFSATGLKPSTLYVINVASCNAYGCNSADKWTYISTTGINGASKIVPPIFLSGGNPSTTCWNRTFDAGTAAAVGTTINKNSYTCSTLFVDPLQYPKVVPTATTLLGIIQTKFAQSITFSGLAKTYSMSTWSANGGISWGQFLFASSKSPVLGFTITPEVLSATPTTCQINNKLIRFIAPGVCTLTASIGENNIWNASSITRTSFQILP